MPHPDPADHGASRRALVVDDDPVARALALAAGASLPFAWVECADLAGGIAALAGGAALLLVDARLPDGAGARLLAAATSVPPGARIAWSAELDPATDAALAHAGAALRIAKPVGLGALRTVFHRAVGLPLPAYDDDAAIEALGSLGTAASLRALFIAELDAQLESTRAAFGPAREALVHRWLGSCRLVGALALADALSRPRTDPGWFDAVAAECARLLNLAVDR